MKLILNRARSTCGRQRTCTGWESVDRTGVSHVGRDRGDHDACFDGDEIDPGRGHTNPGVDDDSFVEHAIENVDDAGRGADTMKGHPPALYRQIPYERVELVEASLIPAKTWTSRRYPGPRRAFLVHESLRRDGKNYMPACPGELHQDARDLRAS